MENYKEVLKEWESRKPPGRPAKSSFYSMVKEAIEKQIPTNVEMETDEELAFYVCPRCRVIAQPRDYCQICGQKLNWGNTVDKHKKL